jgi:CarboxypepD_reg-like domain
VFLLTLLLGGFHLEAQAQRLTGTVLDDATHAPIPFATVGVVQQALGTVADEAGQFSFDPGAAAPTAEVVVTGVGYAPFRLTVAALRNRSAPIELHLLAVELPTATVQGRHLTERLLGRDERGGLAQLSFTSTQDDGSLDDIGREAGAILRMPKGGYELETLHFYVEHNDFDHLKLRLNLYRVRDGEPDSLLLPQDIRFDLTAQQAGWITVDLRPYHVYLTERRVAATLQWLSAEPTNVKGNFIGIPAAFPSVGHEVVYRQKSQARWTTFRANLSLYFTAQCDE